MTSWVLDLRGEHITDLLGAKNLVVKFGLLVLYLKGIIYGTVSIVLGGVPYRSDTSVQ